MKKKYIQPQIKIITKFTCSICTSSQQEGGVIATAPDIEGEMNCPCGGDPNKCTCSDDCCDCWGCRGWE